MEIPFKIDRGMKTFSKTIRCHKTSLFEINEVLEAEGM